ncbi:Crp/Fnr family transcriptional regulator [Streptomyces sp. FH025]|uniref:Crp/Fnr family transcriptional regulator n=1 Tax=Streptomyces sp. FH025 TaxID=2815937 RepID=UPI001A9E05DE|nr:Crp/Fnr family transcriptional regulator [Streptomyces sp. FH025]MBO1413134.1 Crp/Fnr family transcriptional regulator [Streptomyces sp. FH025]
MPESHREYLGESCWDLLCRLAPLKHRNSGTTLLRQGDDATSVILLEHGNVMVTAHGPHGAEELLAVRGSGEILGEMAVLTNGRRSATVRTLEPCRVRVVTAAKFSDLVDEHDLLRRLLQHSYSRIRESDRTKLELATGSVALRLASLLSRLADTAATDGPVRIQLPQEDLARLIGASRNAVGRALKEWSGHGWLTTSAGGGLTVTNLAALRSHAATA